MRLFFAIVVMFTFMTAYAEKITIYAAASTTNAMNEIIADFKKETGIDAVGSYASSGTLAKQIENSAPADIFISANVKWMDYLVEKAKVKTDTVAPLLANRLALVAPLQSSLLPTELTKEKAAELLSSAKRIAMGDPAHVPAGKYAQKTLEALGIWNKLESKVLRMQNVRVALATIEKNAVPLGIVYSSDAALSDKVKIVGIFDETLHGPIRYPIAIIDGKESDAVFKFYNFLKTEKSAKIFQKYGFMAVK